MLDTREIRDLVFSDLLADVRNDIAEMHDHIKTSHKVGIKAGWQLDFAQLLFAVEKLLECNTPFNVVARLKNSRGKGIPLTISCPMDIETPRDFISGMVDRGILSTVETAWSLVIVVVTDKKEIQTSQQFFTDSDLSAMYELLA